MKFITILTTILLQSVRASKQNVFDTELLAAMEFLPSEDVVTRPGTLIVYDNEGNMHYVADDEHFGPPPDNVDPSEDVAIPGTSTVYDNEGNMHVVANDENFGPPSDNDDQPSIDDDIDFDLAKLPPDDTDQLDETSSVVVDEENFGPPTDGINSDVADDLMFGPPTDGINSDVANEPTAPPSSEIKYFQIHSLYEVDGTQVCLQPKSEWQGSTIVVKPCVLDDSSESLQWWTVDALGQFQNKENMDLCMTHAPESKLKLKPCLKPESRSTTKLSTSFFIYNYFTNQIHYTRNPLRIVTIPPPSNRVEADVVLLVNPSAGNSRLSGLVENKVTKWAVNYL